MISYEDENKQENETMIEKDWIERKTDELLTRARSTGFFSDVIKDARWIRETDAVVWDVALAISLKYWER